MSASQGADTRVGIGFESADNLYQGYDGASGITQGVRVRSLPGWMADRPLEDSENLDPSGQETTGVSVAAMRKTKIPLQSDVETVLPFLLNQCGWWETTLLAAGATSWKVRPEEDGDTPATGYVDSFSLEADTADGKPLLGFGNRVDEIAVKINEGKITGVEISMLGTHDTYIADAREVAVNAAMTGRCFMYGHRNDPTDTTPLSVICSTGGGSGVAQVKAAKGYVTAPPSAPTVVLAGVGAGLVTTGTHSYKLTFTTAIGESAPSASSNVVTTDTATDGKVTVPLALGPTGTTGRKIYRRVAGDTGAWKLVATVANNTATSYLDNIADGSLGADAPAANTFYATSTAYTVTYGTPIRVKVAADARAGISRYEEVWLVFLDAAATGSVLTALDQWSFDASRTAATPDYPDTGLLHSAGVEVTIASVAYHPHSVELKFTRPRKAGTGTGSKYAYTIQPNGKWKVMASFNRDADDRVMINQLIAGGLASVVVAMYGSPIGATAYDYLWSVSMPNMQIKDLGRDVENENLNQEKVSVSAKRVGATPAFTHTLQVPLADFAALISEYA